MSGESVACWKYYWWADLAAAKEWSTVWVELVMPVMVGAFG